jgi:hypothetical protein
MITAAFRTRINSHRNHLKGTMCVSHFSDLRQSYHKSYQVSTIRPKTRWTRSRQSCKAINKDKENSMQISRHFDPSWVYILR